MLALTSVVFTVCHARADQTRRRCDPRVQTLVMYSVLSAEALSLSPSVGTLLYWQPGTTSTADPAGSGSAEGSPRSDNFLSLLSSRQKDTMRKTAAEVTTTLQAKKTGEYWPVLSTRTPAKTRKKSSLMESFSYFFFHLLGKIIFSIIRQ